MNSRVLRLSSLSILIALALTSDPDELHNLAADPRQATRLASLRADLDAWMQQQGDTQTVFGKPLLEGEPVTLIAPGNAKKKSP